MSGYKGKRKSQKASQIHRKKHSYFLNPIYPYSTYRAPMLGRISIFVRVAFSLLNKMLSV